MKMNDIKAYPIENHPCDSRVVMSENGIVQTLNARMGTWGGNTPYVLISQTDSHNIYKVYQRYGHPAETRAEVEKD